MIFRVTGQWRLGIFNVTEFTSDNHRDQFMEVTCIDPGHFECQQAIKMGGVEGAALRLHRTYDLREVDGIATTAWRGS